MISCNPNEIMCLAESYAVTIGLLSRIEDLIWVVLDCLISADVCM